MTRRRDDLAVRRAERELAKVAEHDPEGVARALARASTVGGLQAMLGGPRIGRPPSPDPMLALTIRLPGSLISALESAAANAGVPRTTAIRLAVERWVRAQRRRR